MLELLQKLLYLDWRRHGALIREVTVARSRMWYAEFPPRVERPAGPELVEPKGAVRRNDASFARRSARPPVAILIHGLGASSTSFYPLIPRLLRRFRVIVPDLPGYGGSRPPRGRDHLLFPELVEAAEKFVHKVAPRGAYLVGTSRGGWIAAKLASARPDLVRGIALLNPGGPALHAEDWVDFARVLYAEDRAVMGEYFSRLFHNPPVALRLFTRDFQRIMRGPAVASLVASLAESDFIAAEELARVRCPSLLVWGESDRLIPAGCRDFYLRHLPGVRYEPLNDCGHCPQLEAPKRTAELVMQLPALAAAGESEAA
ncbi:MAG TPA: alpha/beta hydrolase [Anaeromyxobacteraceae bacterium]|nr:alpha/beta hydrolase [Anaeromyxobacteraceae bacterium]